MSLFKIKNQKLKDLDIKIQNIKNRNNNTDKNSNMFKSAHTGWRMVIELVIGIVLGVIIGFGIDTFFNTSPIFLVIMTFFGFAAGIKTMLKSANEINKKIE